MDFEIAALFFSYSCDGRQYKVRWRTVQGQRTYGCNFGINIVPNLLKLGRGRVGIVLEVVASIKVPVIETIRLKGRIVSSL